MIQHQHKTPAATGVLVGGYVNFDLLRQQTLGNWYSILAQYGLELKRNRHQPCPICGGKDRFRFDDREGRGTYFCNQCGAGDGLQLLAKYLNLTVIEAAKELSRNLGVINIENRVMRPYTKPDIAFDTQCLTDEWNKCSPVNSEHTYLINKKISGVFVKQKDNQIVVPVFSKRGNLQSLQYISPTGSKVFKKGSKVKGGSYLIGSSDLDTVLVCEGYATGETLHNLTGFPVLITFNCFNLLPCSEMLRDKGYRRIFICADNDAHLEVNIGMRKALEAANKTASVMILPPSMGDFNDLYINSGKEVSLELLGRYLSWPL